MTNNIQIIKLICNFTNTLDETTHSWSSKQIERSMLKVRLWRVQCSLVSNLIKLYARGQRLHSYDIIIN
jgi:hypothetical protein